ncbi:MAG: DUF5665 domain-containing protein [Candidatus Levybacteria bacterium]|nr:DUF5665 domain-containing protein [Candidatus Levybacteria bacterium]
MAKSENVYRSRKRMLIDNFFGGITWALGVWVGTTIVIAFLAYFISQINLIPALGSFVAEVSKYAEQSKSPFNF